MIKIPSQWLFNVMLANWPTIGPSTEIRFIGTTLYARIRNNLHNIDKMNENKK